MAPPTPGERFFECATAHSAVHGGPTDEEVEPVQLKMAARVSILLPAYDAAATLPACLRSIRRQTLVDWECVIVDDGSVDDTAALAAAAMAEDPRFRLIRRPHQGLVATLNAGLRYCRGEYVARMDADDLMHRERLRAQVELLQRDARLAAVGCHVRIFPRAQLGLGWREYEAWVNQMDSPGKVRADAFIESPVVHPTLVFRRQLLAQLGYRDCGWAEDYDLVLRVLDAGYEIGVVPRRLLSWRDSSGRLTRSDRRCAVERFVACKAAVLAQGFLAPSAHYALWGYGATGRALRRALRAHGKELAYAVDVHPGRLGNRIERAPVIGPEQLAEAAPVPLIVSVAGARPRAEIRDYLRSLGKVELKDFVCAA